MASESGHPHAEGLSAAAAGVVAFFAGEWKQASSLCERELVVLRDQCPGATWEMDCAQIFSLVALLLQGEIGDVSRRLPALLAAAKDRGNRFFETELRTTMNLVWLAADEPDEGERQADEAMAGWSHQGFHRQHYSHVVARIQTALYRGDGAAAWDVAASNWPALERALILRVQCLRIEALFLRARAALLNAAGGRDVKRFLSIARTDARRIRRAGLPWSDAIAMLLSATVTYLEGGRDDACDMAAAAVAAFERADMMLHAAVVRRRLGVLQDGERGRALVAAADAWMAAHGIKNPARMARLIAPGFPDPDDV